MITSASFEMYGQATFLNIQYSRQASCNCSHAAALVKRIWAGHRRVSDSNNLEPEAVVVHVYIHDT